MGYTGLDVNGLVTLQTGIVSGIDLGDGDVVLSPEQSLAGRLEVTTGHASNAIVVPKRPGKIYIVANAHESLVADIEVAGGSPVTVAAASTDIVMINSAGAMTRVTRVAES